VVHHEPQVSEGAHLLEAEVEAVLELVLPGEVVHGALVEILKVGDVDGGAAVVTRSSPAHLDIELTQGRHPAVIAITWSKRDAIDHSKNWKPRQQKPGDKQDPSFFMSTPKSRLLHF